MPIRDILEYIDHQISQLQHARTLLAGEKTAEVPVKRHGRPKGATRKTETTEAAAAKKVVQRHLPAEGSAGIAPARKPRSSKQEKSPATLNKSAFASSSNRGKKMSKAAGKKAVDENIAGAENAVTPTKSISPEKTATMAAEA